MVKNPPAIAGDADLIPGLGRSPEEGTHSSLLAWKCHRQRRLVGYSPRGRKELDSLATEYTHTQDLSLLMNGVNNNKILINRPLPHVTKDLI